MHLLRSCLLLLLLQSPAIVSLAFDFVFCGSSAVSASTSNFVGLTSILPAGIASSLRSVILATTSPQLDAAVSLSVASLTDVNTADSLAAAVGGASCIATGMNCSCVSATLQVRSVHSAVPPPLPPPSSSPNCVLLTGSTCTHLCRHLLILCFSGLCRWASREPRSERGCNRRIA
jgi:hypothetical protein